MKHYDHQSCTQVLCCTTHGLRVQKVANMFSILPLP